MVEAQRNANSTAKVNYNLRVPTSGAGCNFKICVKNKAHSGLSGSSGVKDPGGWELAHKAAHIANRR